MYLDSLNKKYLHPKRKRREGYTLLEVVISILFFAIIAIGLSLPYCNSISLTVADRNINNSNNLARSYLKEVETEWQIQADFDTGILVEIDENYTENGKYTVNVDSQDIALDNDGIVLIRRINITYFDSAENVLSDIYYDYNRPGGV